ncbi:hypothetical protein [Streptomyces sp. NPDC050485]|uniref:hypothetical protein n=1 Tax=Streptomyces sp. NPDC050485 TaxID=3365617 RepID=UPI0037ABE5C9
MTERAVLDALTAVPAGVPPVSHGWTESLWELYEAYEKSRSGRGPAPQLTAEQTDRFAAQWGRQEHSAEALGLLGELCVRAGRAGLAAPAEAAGLAVRLARAGLAAHEAVTLLYALGAPHGEQALLALVRDREIGEADRLWARERLFALRRGGYRARGEQAPPDWLEVRLLVRELMPMADRVTRERMAEAEHECALLCFDGGEGFGALWTTRMAAWLADEIFGALGRGPDPAALTPWAMDLAEQYVTRGMAAESARGFLRRTEDATPYGHEVVRRLSP